MKTSLNSSNVMYPELSYSIVGAAMEVHNSLKPGWDEWDYHRAMITALGTLGHSVASHERKELMCRGRSIDTFELDLLVDDLIILELKHLKEGFHPVHYTQIINYLKCWEKRLGMLINFGQEKLRYTRVPFSCRSVKVDHVGSWAGVSVEMRGVVDRAVSGILSEIGFGYGTDAFKKLLLTELDFLGVHAQKVCLTPEFNGQCFEMREVDAWFVGEELMIGVSTASSAADLSHLKTYMKHSNVKNGILVSLDRSGIQLRGIL